MLQSLGARAALGPQENVWLRESGERPPLLAVFRGFQIRVAKKQVSMPVIHLVFFHRAILFYFYMFGYQIYAKSDTIYFEFHTKMNWTSSWAVKPLQNPGVSGIMLI